MADKCEDVSTQEELSICCRWIVNGCTEEHFMLMLHIIKATDAETIAAAITSYIESKNLMYSKLLGQGCDGAAPFLWTTCRSSKVNACTCWACNLHSLLMSPFAISEYSSCTKYSTNSKNVWNDYQSLETVLLFSCNS